MRRYATRPLCTAGIAALFTLCAFAQAPSGPVWISGKVKPSENAGKEGQYHCNTSHPGYNYWVYVPKTYSEANPAGLHIFFHGQGSQGSAKSFHRWAKYFLEPYNLIGINMEYMDGDNAKDTAGKVHAAEEAIAQTMADYKIVLGRGVISSFSGGGLPHKGVYSRYGQNNTKDPSAWPFNHTALYGSNFWANASSSLPMSWFVGLGGKEWNMGKPTLGSSQYKRAHERLTVGLKGECPDAYLKIIAEKGHDIWDADVEISAELFRRSDIVLAPFVYQPDFEEKELKPIAAAANSRQLGATLDAIDRLLKKPGLTDEVKAKAGKLKKQAGERVDAVVSLAGELADKDAVLLDYYGQQTFVQLARHPRQKELRDILKEAARKREYRAALAAFALFVKDFTSFVRNAKVDEKLVPLLEQIKEASGEASIVGRMAADFLLLKPEEDK